MKEEKDKLPTEVVENVLSHVTVEDIMDEDRREALFTAIGATQPSGYYTDLVNRRTDPRHMLRQIVPDPESLLETLVVTHSFLSGSRAADFFCPGLCTTDSDWDFYCIGNACHSLFLYMYFLSLGYELTDKRTGNTEDAGDTEDELTDAGEIEDEITDAYPNTFSVLSLTRNEGNAIDRSS